MQHATDQVEVGSVRQQTTPFQTTRQDSRAARQGINHCRASRRATRTQFSQADHSESSSKFPGFDYVVNTTAICDGVDTSPSQSLRVHGVWHRAVSRRGVFVWICSEAWIWSPEIRRCELLATADRGRQGSRIQASRHFSSVVPAHRCAE